MHTRVYALTRACANTHAQIYGHAYIHAHAFKQTCTHIHPHILIKAHICKNACSHAYTYTNTHIHKHVYIYTHDAYIFRHVSIQSQIDIYAYKHINMYVSTCALYCVIAFLYVPMHIENAQVVDLESKKSSEQENKPGAPEKHRGYHEHLSPPGSRFHPQTPLLSLLRLT